MFPASPLQTKPTIKDTIYSFHHPSTPYGFGLALLGISTSASLSLPPLSDEPTSEEVEALFKNRTSPPATLVFSPSTTLATPLYTLVLSKMLGDSGIIIKQARNGKLRLLRQGSVSKKTIWDTILFKGIRQELGVHMLRGVYFAGPLEQGKLETFRCAFGTPAVSTLSHPFLLAPLSHGHFYDYQRLPPPGVVRLSGKEKGHVGAPSAGVEVKVRGREVDMESGRLRGEVSVALSQTTQLLPVLTPKSYRRFSSVRPFFLVLRLYLPLSSTPTSPSQLSLPFQARKQKRASVNGFKLESKVKSLLKEYFGCPSKRIAF